VSRRATDASSWSLTDHRGVLIIGASPPSCFRHRRMIAIAKGLDEAIKNVGELIAKSEPVNDVVHEHQHQP